MSFKDWIGLCGIRLGLRSFYTLRIFLILQIELDIYSGSIFLDEINYGKVRYLIF